MTSLDAVNVFELEFFIIFVYLQCFQGENKIKQCNYYDEYSNDKIIRNDMNLNKN